MLQRGIGKNEKKIFIMLGETLTIIDEAMMHFYREIL